MSKLEKINRLYSGKETRGGTSLPHPKTGLYLPIIAGLWMPSPAAITLSTKNQVQQTRDYLGNNGCDKKSRPKKVFVT
jgi:hypothetical protein